ncbi:MAG TPA: prenyltransferase/squalene oxidase repeat-containing protein [Nitrospirales bacterium]|nr:prenyltransferase/squalene oxidase repeat-containing protein [Nitrospirales bacterium]
MTVLLEPIRAVRRYLRLTAEARAEIRRDRLGLPEEDPGAEHALEAAIQWLCRAQDHSETADGGVARHYSLLTGWGPSYPETTGYIIPTMLSYARRAEDHRVRDRARYMLDWLTSIQLPDGGFQGGTVDARPVVPVTFNTGQILIGLAAGATAFGARYREAMRRAGDWLVATQDPDGCWRKHPTPFAQPGEKVYETHVAWGLLEAARVEPYRGYAEAALSNVYWAVTHQKVNGWFARCCLTDARQPLTHTIGYALRGIIEAYRYSRDGRLLTAARRTADGLLSVLAPDGFIPGRLKWDWQGTVEWACLTGSVQIASCWLLLYGETGHRPYRDAAFTANRFVRRTLRLDGPLDTRGAVKGSFPVSGDYGAYQYLNWAAKFFVDAMLLELAVRETGGRVVHHDA